MGTPLSESFPMRSRRLLLLLALTVAPLAAACVGSPTAPDATTTQTKPDSTASTARREQLPWN